MTIVSLYEQAGMTRLVLDGGAELSLRAEYLAARGAVPAVGPAEPDVEEAVLFAAACQEAEAAALRLVARAEQCERGLLAKLRERRHAKEAAERAVRRLARDGLVDDRRYARLWLAARLARKADSPRTLRALLYAKGIPRDIAARALSEALTEDAEIGLLRRMLASRDAPPPDKAALRAEGFSREVIDLLE